MSRTVAVTVLTGTPGNDGAHAFDQIVKHSGDVQLSAIVPKRSRKRKRPSGEVKVIPTTEHLVRLGQGCSCCTVRGDLMAKVQRIAEEQSAEHILIHASPHADLQTLAKTFTVADDNGAVLSDLARIGSLVTVVNAARFFETVGGANARAMIERIELSNVVLLEGTAGIDNDEVERVRGAVTALNAGASIVLADGIELDLTSLRAQQPFDLNLAEERASGAGVSGDVASGTVRFSFEARRPFHPSRLFDLLGDLGHGILRLKGTIWVATKPDYACALDMAGGNRTFVPEGQWWATVPEHELPNRPDLKSYLESVWHPDFGDRHQSISIVGVGIDEGVIRACLQAALLTDSEVESRDTWASMPDPLPWPAAAN